MALGPGELDGTALLVVLLLGVVMGLFTGVARLTSRVVRDVPEAVRVGIEMVPTLYAHYRQDPVSTSTAPSSDAATHVSLSDVVRTLLYAEVWAYVSVCIRARVPVGARVVVEWAARRAFTATARKATRDVRRRRARRRLVQSVLHAEQPFDARGVEWMTSDAVYEVLDAGRRLAHRQSRRIRWATAAILLTLAALPTAWLAMTHT